MHCFGACFAPEAARDQDTRSARSPQHSAGFLGSSASQASGACPQQTHGGGAGAGAGGAARSAHGSKAGLKAKLPLKGRSRSQQVQPREDVQQLWQHYLLQHGRDIMGLSTLLQEGLQHFVMPGVGYIAYGMMFNGPEILNKRTAVALSDPVCDPQHFRALAEAFLRCHPEAMFVQASAEFAAVLQDLGFTVNSIGGETRLDLAAYNFTGHARRGLRSAIASATKEGVTVAEVMQPPADSLRLGGPSSAGSGSAADVQWSSLAAEMQMVDAKWAAGRTGRASDFWFTNRKPVFAGEPGVRKLVARDATGALLGFIFFDAVFAGGQLAGYYANVTRMLPDAHPGTLNVIMKAFIETVRAEAQLATPAKKLSMRRSLRKKQAAAAAAAAADTSDTAMPDQQRSKSVTEAAADSAAADSAAAAAESPAPASRPLFLSLGLSPFCQMDNSRFNACSTTAKALERFWDLGDAFYPAKTLAAAKAKYGAGLHNFKYEDPAVEYRQAYLCHRRGKAALVAVFDLAKFFGMWRHPADCATRFLAFKVKQKLRRQGSGAAERANSLRSASSTGSALSSCSAASATTAASAKSSSSRSGGSSSSSKPQLAAGAGTAAAAAAAAAAAVAGANLAASQPSSPPAGTAASLIGIAVGPPSVRSSNQRLSSEGGSDVSYVSATSSGGSAAAAGNSSQGAAPHGSRKGLSNNSSSSSGGTGSE